jgi:hypothetical protein
MCRARRSSSAQMPCLPACGGPPLALLFTTRCCPALLDRQALLSCRDNRAETGWLPPAVADCFGGDRHHVRAVHGHSSTDTVFCDLARPPRCLERAYKLILQRVSAAIANANGRPPAAAVRDGRTVTAAHAYAQRQMRCTPFAGHMLLGRTRRSPGLLGSRTVPRIAPPLPCSMATATMVALRAAVCPRAARHFSAASPPSPPLPAGWEQRVFNDAGGIARTVPVTSEIMLWRGALLRALCGRRRTRPAARQSAAQCSAPQESTRDRQP